VSEPSLVPELVSLIVAATVQRHEAEDLIRQLIANRAEWIWTLVHVEQQKQADVARMVEDQLRDLGWTSADIKGSGVGLNSIRKIVARPKPSMVA
jgi:hypothetical protein